jgi:hypothetical protein
MGCLSGPQKKQKGTSSYRDKIPFAHIVIIKILMADNAGKRVAFATILKLIYFSNDFNPQ